MALHPYRVYAKTAGTLLADARDWLKSDWTPGRGPTDEEADGKADALLLIGYAKAALDGSYRLTDEAKRALAGEEEG